MPCVCTGEEGEGDESVDGRMDGWLMPWEEGEGEYQGKAAA